MDPTSVGSLLGLQQKRKVATDMPEEQESSPDAQAPEAQEQSAADELEAIMQGNTVASFEWS